MATKTSWHRYGTKLRHCHRMYTSFALLHFSAALWMTFHIAIEYITFTNASGDSDVIFFISMAAFCRRHVVRKKTRNLCYFVVSLAKLNKAVIDRRLRPRCCHLKSYFRRPKSSPVCPLACNWYHCAHFAAKPKAACGLRFSWAATSSHFGFE